MGSLLLAFLVLGPSLENMGLKSFQSPNFCTYLVLLSLTLMELRHEKPLSLQLKFHLLSALSSGVWQLSRCFLLFVLLPPHSFAFSSAQALLQYMTLSMKSFDSLLCISKSGSSTYHWVSFIDYIKCVWICNLWFINRQSSKQRLCSPLDGAPFE